MNALLRDKRLPVWLLIAASVAAVPLLVYLQRDAGIWQDEWTFLLYRAGWSPSDILGQFNGQLFALTPIILNLDRAIFSAGANGPLTAVSIIAQIALVWGAFSYLRVRLGEWIAAGCALLILLYGTGYELLVWNFNFGWLTALAAGIWALVIFESGDTKKKSIGASALLFLALTGDNNSVVFIAALLVYALYKETRRRALLVAGIPMATFVIWWLIEGGGSSAGSPKTWPDWIAAMIEGTFSGLTGDIGGTNSWGAPLAVFVIGVMVYLLSRERTIRPALAVALSMPLIFIGLVTLGRGGISDPTASRYRYTLILLVGMALAELIRGQRIRTLGAALGFVGVLGFFIASNFVVLPTGAQSIKGGFALNRYYTTALLMAGEKVANTTDYLPRDPGLGVRGNKEVYRFLTKGGGENFAWTPAELAAEPPEVQAEVQHALKQIRSGGLGTAMSPSP